MAPPPVIRRWMRRRLSRPGLRFALYYAAFYAVLGAYLPYMPVWFESRGLPPEWIGAAAAAGMAGRVLAAPLGALWSDRAADRRGPILAFAAAALLIFLAHAPAREPALILVLAGLAGAAFTGAIPLTDAFAAREARRGRFAFGPARATGSAAFIIGNLGAGAWISSAGGAAALYWILIFAALAVGAAALLPRGERPAARPTPSSGGDPAGFSALLGAGLPLAFAASALIQGAHAFYYGFSAVAWTAQGIAAGWVGALWSTGVAAEIALFAVSARLFRGWSPAALMVLGGCGAVARWLLLSLAPPLVLLFPLQTLHALSFAAAYLGFLRYATDNAPENMAATAQAVNSALSGGLVLAAGTLVSGWAYARFGAGGFALMAAPAGVGLACAALLQRRSTKPPL